MVICLLMMIKISEVEQKLRNHTKELDQARLNQSRDLTLISHISQRPSKLKVKVDKYQIVIQDVKLLQRINSHMILMTS